MRRKSTKTLWIKAGFEIHISQKQYAQLQLAYKNKNTQQLQKLFAVFIKQGILKGETYLPVGSDIGAPYENPEEEISVFYE